jgi:membrane protease subunit HflK
MTEPNDQNPLQQPLPDGDVPIEGVEPMEVEPQPRRTASARFEVETEVGSEAALREAMDPANQSLADALRLSFRVLQVVIVVLVVLFLISGFRTVKGNESGVMLRFGRIVEVDGQPDLEPGLRRNLVPYPGGEFIIFDVENLVVDLGDTFWPTIPPNVTLDHAIERSHVRSALKPGEVGTVIAGDGDLAHLKLNAVYEISGAVSYVKHIKLGDADRIVELALQRATVHAAAGLSLQELVDQPEQAEVRIKQAAQEVLDSLDCGIRLTSVHLPDTKPPFAIVKVYRELQNAREEGREVIEKARQEADEELIQMAGPGYADLSRMIESYEEAQDLNDADRVETLLARINAFLESDEVRGEVREIIERAKAHESEIERTLGSEARWTSSSGGSGWRRDGRSWAARTSRSSACCPGRARSTSRSPARRTSPIVAAGTGRRSGKGTPGSRRPGSSSSIRYGPRTMSPVRRARPSRGTRATGSAPGAASGNERLRGFWTFGWFHQARIRSLSRPWG